MEQVKVDRLPGASALLLSMALLAWPANAWAVTEASIGFDFQSVPPGRPLEKGYIDLTVSGVYARFSGNTEVSVDPVTGTHVLHSVTYAGGIGMQFSRPLSQITIGISETIPSSDNFVRCWSFYAADGNLIVMPTITNSGSTLVYDVPPDSRQVWGLLVDGRGGNGYALENVSIQLLPEPTSLGLLAVGALALMMTSRRR